VPGLRRGVRQRRFAAKVSKEDRLARSADLDGLYLRSKWERNIARWLKLLHSRGEIARWVFEWRDYEFPVKRGTRFYKPDFAVWESDAYTEHADYYYEVKGYLDAKSTTALTRMRKYYPEVKVLLIEKTKYAEIEAANAHLIERWER
jgi:hypothetical protein